MLHDLRFGVRLLARQPGFTAAAVLTLALGIGANAAIFSIAWQMMLRPLPYPHSDRLVTIWEAYGPQDAINTIAPGNYHDWTREARSFEAIAAYSYFRTPANLTGGGDPEQLQIRYVTGGYFRVFGMTPLAGRGLDERDVTPDSRSIVISEGLWRRRFGADPSIVGREVRLSDRAQVVVGVMPAAFDVAAGRVDAWSGYAFSPQQAESRGAHYLGAVGRLEPGVTLGQAIAEVKTIAARAAAQFPASNRNTSATVHSIHGERGRTFRTGLAILAWAAGFVLLIACANLASLQMARGTAREREFGIRAALGASRGRLVLQVAVESLIVASIGAASGLILSMWMLRVLSGIAPESIRVAAEAGTDAVVVLYSMALAAASAVIFALAPAWRAAARATTWLRARGATADRSTATIRTVLVTVEIALAVVLLTGATLLVTSLTRVLRVDPGFDAAGVLTFDVSLPPGKYDTRAKEADVLARIADQMRAVPGIVSACAINTIPFDEDANMTYVPEGQEKPVSASPRTMTPECLDVLRMRLTRGRSFSEHETRRVAIVTERFASTAWPDRDPIGRRVHLGVKDGALIEIVGVVADTRQRSLENRPAPVFFENASAEAAFRPTRMLARSAVPPASVFAAVREAVRRVDAGQPVARLRTLEDVVASSVSGRRFDLSLVGSFSMVALVLSAVGIYGLLSQIVAQRTGEIGIRLALGATEKSVVRLVMKSAWISTTIGTAIGVLGAIAASRLLQQMIFGVSATDPRLYGGVAGALALISLTAAWIPARRAARIDAVSALRI